jgi:hypothetical protein
LAGRTCRQNDAPELIDKCGCDKDLQLSSRGKSTSSVGFEGIALQAEARQRQEKFFIQRTFET